MGRMDGYHRSKVVYLGAAFFQDIGEEIDRHEDL